VRRTTRHNVVVCLAVNPSDQQIQDFIDAWKSDLNDTLSLEVAKPEAERLLAFSRQFGEVLATIRARQKRAEVPDHGGVRKAWQTMMSGRR
jgi:hypothetical protein